MGAIFWHWRATPESPVDNCLADIKAEFKSNMNKQELDRYFSKIRDCVLNNTNTGEEKTSRFKTEVYVPGATVTYEETMTTRK